jgi:sodium/hydrogen antiporter
VDDVLLVAGLLGVLIAASARHLERWSVSPALLGLVAGVVIGPRVLDLLSIPSGEDIGVMTTAARLLLAVALMAIGLRYPIAEVRRRLREVAVLVGVVLPVMVGVVAAGAALLLDLPLGLALVVGAALSPTDPVLASGIVTGTPAEEDIPERSRQVLSLEAGANDGLALPFVTVAIALALGHSLPPEVGLAVYQVLGALAVGGAVGWAGSKALQWGEQHHELGTSARAVYTLVLAALVLGLTKLLRADDLLGVFVAGLVHNAVVSGGDRELEVGVDEALNRFLIVPVFVLLGVVLPWTGWAELGWRGIGLVAVVLFLRRLPVVLALRRPLRSSLLDAAWFGWFGPVGVAALFYLGHVHEHGVTNEAVWAVGTLVVAISTIVYGFTAGAGRLVYRRAG